MIKRRDEEIMAETFLNLVKTVKFKVGDKEKMLKATEKKDVYKGMKADEDDERLFIWNLPEEKTVRQEL